MKEDNRTVASKYNEQARYFLEAAMLASNYAKEKGTINPITFHNFEGVIVGTHHSFAAELLLKGIIHFHTGSHPTHEHKINKLLQDESCGALKESIINNFNPQKHISFNKETLDSILDEYISKLDVRNDKSEIENINRIRKKFSFGSFDYFLELHSNHFIKMRYACETIPPPLDMNFTSFLNTQLRNELENNLLELGENNSSQ